jgi:hypothetical protein
MEWFMNTSLTEAIKEAYAIAPASKIVIHTLQISQDGVQDPIYIAQSRHEFVALDEHGVQRYYAPVGFQFSLPSSDEEGFKSLTIAIDNVDRRVTEFVDIAKSEEQPVKVIYRPYLSDDLSGPQMIPPLVLFLKELQITTFQVVGRATFMDIVNKPFPNQLYTRDRFPALR